MLRYSVNRSMCCVAKLLCLNAVHTAPVRSGLHLDPIAVAENLPIRGSGAISAPKKVFRLFSSLDNNSLSSKKVFLGDNIFYRGQSFNLVT